jgi:hypothetical protein
MALTTSASSRTIARCGLALGILATIAAIHLHWISFTHSGGLWRDEAGITNIATLPSLAAVWKAMPQDQSPILFLAVIRGWSAVFGGTDSALRVLGFGIGLLLLGSLWIAGRLMWRGVPLLSLTLFGLDVFVVRYGDTLRSYGLGTACIVLAMAVMWWFVEKPTLLRGIGAAVIATVSVQVLYQNAVFVLGLCMAGCIVLWSERRHRQAVGALAIGVIPAFSFVPYVRPLVLAQNSFWIVNKTGVSVSSVWAKIDSVAGYPLPLFRVPRLLWLIAVFIVLVLAVKSLISVSRGTDAGNRERLTLFVGIALLVGMAGFASFLVISRRAPQSWHFLMPMGFAIVCCDAALSSLPRRAQVAVLGVAATIALLAYFPGARALQFRQTNGDIMAAQLSRLASPSDLIIVNPWYCAVTFNRYYHGPTPWTTLPDLGDYSHHRYDLLKLKMESPHPDRPVLDRVSETLKAGHRVWIVGWVPVIRVGKEPPPDLPPAPNSPSGWLEGPYDQRWGSQLYYLIALHGRTAKVIPIDPKDPVDYFENMLLGVVSGWRGADDPPTTTP